MEEHETTSQGLPPEEAPADEGAAPGAGEPGAPADSAGADDTSRVEAGDFVALTFDDGPSDFTPRILEILARQRVPATFFVIGKQAQAHPGTLRDIRRAGHELANHTFTHSNLTTLSNAGIADELRRTGDVLRDRVGVSPKLARPPQGATSIRVRSVIHGRGMKHVLWTIDPLDWSRPGADQIRSRVLNAADGNEIVLMHDGGPTERSQTVAALDGIINGLRARGYGFLTVSDFIDRLAPGFRPWHEVAWVP